MARGLSVLLALAAVPLGGGSATAGPRLPRVLFLTHSAGFRHTVVARAEDGSLSHAERLLKKAAEGLFDVEATQDCGAITAANLARFQAVVLYTTGELPVPEADREALLEFIRKGGGFAGIHPATDTWYKWPAYGGLIGGFFDGHPWHQKVRVRVEDRTHPSTAHLGETFEITDEIYQFRDWERGKVQVLLSLDPESVDLGAKGVHRKDRDFGLAWCRPYGEGRVFYTALGHREEVWEDGRFLRHLVQGIVWAMGGGKGGAAGAETDDEGFVPLFTPERLEEWKQAGPGRFTFEDGVATPHGGMGLWWYSGRRFGNFIFKVEFRQEDVKDNSGVFVRFPDPEGDPWKPVREGYEVQIAGDQPSKSSTGAVYSFQAAGAVPIRPAGEWNGYEIACVGQQYSVRLNGRLINVFQGERGLTGFVGLQNHCDQPACKVRYRNARVRELPEDAVAYHVLFEGDRGGWRMAGPGSFDLSERVLTSRGGMGLYWHERSFKDFILLLDWKVGRGEDNSGVFVRFPDPEGDPWKPVREGYEIQICDPAQPKHRTGSVYSFQDATEVPTKPVGEWNHYEIAARGQRLTVRINGRLVNDFAGERSLEGHVGLQNHDDASRVSFRDIRVVELK